MKSINKFIYLSKNAGVFYSIFYIVYKIALKFQFSNLSKKYNERKTAWLNTMYSHLFVLNNKKVFIEGRELLEINLNNQKKIYLRPFTSDLKVFYQIFGNEEYKAVINIYNQLFLDSPQNIIDLGANVGLASIYLGTEYNSAKFKLIEPSLDNLEIARLNLKLNRIDFSDLEGGAWNKNTMLNLNRDFRDGKEWSINLSENQNGNIKGYSIKDIIDQYDTPIDILKIDIEGAEKILFEDSIYAFGFLEKVKCIALEIHDEYECREMIYNTLKLNGFIYFDTKETTIAVNRKYLMAAL